MQIPHQLFASLLLSLCCSISATAADYDVVVYGGTGAAVTSAVQAKKMGKSVVIVCPDKHLGGLSSGGIGFTDTGNKAVIGGLAHEFYQRVWKHYNQPQAWNWQKREEYGNKGQGTPAIDGEQRTMWIFEPHVAEQVFEDFIREFEIPVFRDEWLDRDKGVKKDGARIISITMLSGKMYSGRMFIDATYEGDLMAAAGVEYHVGREASSVHDEDWNGVQTGVLHHRHHFGVLKEKIDPYIVPGDPKSGVLPRISTRSPGEYGKGDKRVQAYCYRTCLTDLPENRVPFAKPEGYDPKQYELLLRIYAAGWRETFEKFDAIPNRKTDTNNHGPMSTDNIGYSDEYPEASYQRRREILKEHETYQKGWLYLGLKAPYDIAYGAIIPESGQADNLLVPVCVSSSHIAFGSIRMEPVFMILGQSAATAACLAIDNETAVQKLDYAKLRERLLVDKQILEWKTHP